MMQPRLPLLSPLPLLVLAIGCQPSPPDISPGVSWALAQHRARTLSDIRYELAFTIPADLKERIYGVASIQFTLSDASQPVVLDFTASDGSVLAVTARGRDVPLRVVDGHVVVPTSALTEGSNVVEIEFHAGDGALNRREGFLYTLFVPDRASSAFPSFDQPNLKAVYQLTLTVPTGWTAVSNTAVAHTDSTNEGRSFSFADTKPLSTYLFAFAAGKFMVEAAERDGRRMQMYHRETDVEKVTRNREAIFDLHAAALEWLEEYTGIPYPFSKFDFVLIPSFQYGGMEHPGSILYRASSLLLDESATQNQYLGRASVIAHETGHMWFGDLVTMDWFDDVWMKEVFANFMAAKIVNPSFPQINHELRFFLAHHPAAYNVDRTAGANPIRQELENLKDAGTLYGAIIYQKAPIVMRHLERVMGEAAFRDGLGEYLREYQFGNATWHDLIALLDNRTSTDLPAWSRTWVSQPGRPKVNTELSLDATGRISALRLTQADPLGRTLIWSQRFTILLGYGDSIRSLPVQLNTQALDITDAVGLPAPDFVLAGGDGMAYALFELAPASRDYLMTRLPAIPDPLARSVAWVSLWDALLQGDVAPEALIELALEALPAEGDELNVQRILGYLTTSYWRFLSSETRTAVAPRVEVVLWQELERSSAASRKATYFNAFVSTALTPNGLARLEALWREDQKIPGLPLSERNFSSLALELAVRALPRWETILNDQLARIENPDRRAHFAFVMPALSSDPAVRDSVFESFAHASNREQERWVLEAVRYLHHPLRAGSAERYILPSLALVEEIQVTGDIFFPLRWLNATLGGHNSPTAAATVQQFLDDHPDYPARLRGKVLQAADQLFRAARIVSGS